MKENKDNNHWWYKIIKLFKLELITLHGRINLFGVFLITTFCISYSAADVIKQIISSTEDVIKTITLKTEVYHPYETPSVCKAVIPIILVLVLCLLYIYISEHRKDEIRSIDKNIEEEK